MQRSQHFAAGASCCERKVRIIKVYRSNNVAHNQKKRADIMILYREGIKMRAVVTRVKEAAVSIDGEETARIGKGFLVLLGVHKEDTGEAADRITDRITGLRVFSDAEGKMNVSPKDAGAELLIVSQFTLYADVKSRRPGFSDAARPEKAIPLYERVIEGCRAAGFTVRTGSFGADMEVSSVNDGPVTILLETE